MTMRIYVAAVPLATCVAFVATGVTTSWHLLDLVKFLVLVGCGMISVAATPKTAYIQGGVVKDFLTVWVLPVAILLPPFYALLAPAPLMALTQWYLHRGLLYRRVFSAASISIGYVTASVIFHHFPEDIIGGIEDGSHALRWAIAVGVCEAIALLLHYSTIWAAIKIADPTTPWSVLGLNKEALQADLVEFDLGVLITGIVAITPGLAIIAIPTVLLVRRFMIHAQLVAQSRIDAKTGLLNVSTWEREAETEVSRAVRTRNPVSVMLIDIDHFKLVNDTHGHLVGDKVLRAVADSLTDQLRDYDRAGRFGGEEFVIVLPQTNASDAKRIAERLRSHVAGLVIPVDDSVEAECVTITISIGVATIDDNCRELTDIMAAADAALYYAKRNGRNMTHLFSAQPLIDKNGQAVDRRDAIVPLRAAVPEEFPYALEGDSQRSLPYVTGLQLHPPARHVEL